MVNQDPSPRTAQDLAKRFPGLSSASLNYHAHVLEECGSLTISRGKLAAGGFTHLLVSSVADDPQLVAVLRATESLDEVR
jgi:hypothetical protein